MQNRTYVHGFGLVTTSRYLFWRESYDIFSSCAAGAIFVTTSAMAKNVYDIAHLINIFYLNNPYW